MGLEQPSAQLGDAIDALSRFALADGAPTYDALLAAAGHEPEDEQPLDRLVRRALLSMLEERRTRSTAGS
jgi:hypothetical protein